MEERRIEGGVTHRKAIKGETGCVVVYLGFFPAGYAFPAHHYTTKKLVTYCVNTLHPLVCTPYQCGVFVLLVVLHISVFSCTVCLYYW